MRVFSIKDLAFFAIPRRWVPDIIARFGDDPDVRDAIIHADNYGGLAFLKWSQPDKTWTLTDKGKRWVGDSQCRHGARLVFIPKNFCGPPRRNEIPLNEEEIRRGERAIIVQAEKDRRAALEAERERKRPGRRRLDTDSIDEELMEVEALDESEFADDDL